MREKMRATNRKRVTENTRCLTSAVDLQLGTQMIKAPIQRSRSTLCTPQEMSSGEQLCNKINMCRRGQGGVLCQQCQSAEKKGSLAPGRVSFQCHVNIDQRAKDASNRLLSPGSLLQELQANQACLLETSGRKSITILKNPTIQCLWPLR